MNNQSTFGFIDLMVTIMALGVMFVACSGMFKKCTGTETYEECESHCIRADGINTSKYYDQSCVEKCRLTTR